MGLVGEEIQLHFILFFGHVHVSLIKRKKYGIGKYTSAILLGVSFLKLSSEAI